MLSSFKIVQSIYRHYYWKNLNNRKKGKETNCNTIPQPLLVYFYSKYILLLINSVKALIKYHALTDQSKCRSKSSNQNQPVPRSRGSDVIFKFGLACWTFSVLCDVITWPHSLICRWSLWRHLLKELCMPGPTVPQSHYKEHFGGTGYLDILYAWSRSPALRLKGLRWLNVLWAYINLLEENYRDPILSMYLYIWLILAVCVTLMRVWLWDGDWCKMMLS